MKNLSLRINDSKKDWIPQLLLSTLFILFLSWIDEGNRDFSWMVNPSEWIAYFVFVGLLFGLQILISKFLSTNTIGKRSQRVGISFIGGVIALFMIILFYGFLIIVVKSIMN